MGNDLVGSDEGDEVESAEEYQASQNEGSMSRMNTALDSMKM